MTQACTIGAKIFVPGRHFLLFKNKDFTRGEFDDRVVYNGGFFGIEGMASWNATDPDSDVFSGVSIGLNSSGLSCCDANIRSSPRTQNYDILVEKVLKNCSSVDEAIGFLREEVSQERYGWANLIVATRDEVAALEVSDRVVAERGARQVVRTNHYVRTPYHTIDYHQNGGTKSRFVDALARIRSASSRVDIFDLLRTHRPENRATSICNHGNIATVYSYVLEAKDGLFRLYVCRGHPCKGVYRELPLRFPPRPGDVDRALDSYPSGRLAAGLS